MSGVCRFFCLHFFGRAFFGSQDKSYQLALTNSQLKEDMDQEKEAGPEGTFIRRILSQDKKRNFLVEWEEEWIYPVWLSQDLVEDLEGTSFSSFCFPSKRAFPFYVFLSVFFPLFFSFLTIFPNATSHELRWTRSFNYLVQR